MEQKRPPRSATTTESSQPKNAAKTDPPPNALSYTNTETSTPENKELGTTTTTTATSTTRIQDRHGMNMNTNEEGGSASSNNTQDHKRLSTCSQEHGPRDATGQSNFPPAGTLLVRKYTELVSSIGTHFNSQDNGRVNIDDNDGDDDEVGEEEGAVEEEVGGGNLKVQSDRNGSRGAELNEEENEDVTGTSNGLFKQFDQKTGQFLREDVNLRKRDLGVRRLFDKSESKFRSHSVPAVCHSSLRRLTSYCQNHNHYHYRQNNHQQTGVGSVKKKRAGRFQQHHHHHHHPSHCFVQAAPVVAFANGSGTAASTASTAATTSAADSDNSSGDSSRKSSRCMNSGPAGDDTGATSFGDEPKRTAATVPPPAPPASSSVSTANAATNPDANRATGQTSTNPSLHRSHNHQIKNNLMSNNALRDAILLCHQAQQPSVTKYDELTLQERINAIRDHHGPLPLPPINLQCLREIDLQEIVKNPQLRHDIIFDPLLQFRPNLDGERGIKKKQLADNYWKDVENEVYVYSQSPQIFQYNHTRLVPLFDTLREVLLTIVPQREAHVIHNVLDTELNVQELLRGSLIMTSLSEWLAQLFKHHCAPMRDAWVDKMSSKFKEAEQESSLSKLIDGLRLVFQILEAMKLDIANHQIRILRPALLSNSVEFEKQYFQSLISSDRVDLKSSLAWFKRKYNESVSQARLQRSRAVPRDIYKLCIRSVISLLSCRKMVREYPTSLSFDHARLILLRADIRQIVCLLICRLLFKQLVANDSTLDRGAKNYIDSTGTLKKLKGEIVSIITDEHGNCRWTKNTMAIAIHLCKTITDLRDEYFSQRAPGGISISNNPANAGIAPSSTPALAQAKVDFAKSWLSKQTQPLSEVYGVLEDRVFRSLEDLIFSRSDCTVDGRVKQDFVYLCSNMSNDSMTRATNTSSNNNTTKSIASATSSSSRTVAAPGPISSSPPSTGANNNNNNTINNNNNDNTNTNNNNDHNVAGNDDNNNNASALSSTPHNTNTTAGTTSQGLDMEEFDNVFRHLYAVVNFHWSVFGGHYMDSISDQMGTSIY